MAVKAGNAEIPTAPDRVASLLDELKRFYDGFIWESELWRQARSRRSPYRTLVLFGLSARTRDALLVAMCRGFFMRYPDAPSLADGPGLLKDDAKELVRAGQLPIVVSMAETLAAGVPRDKDSLLQIKGVGEKIAECVLAYGWGEDALPLDANCVRVLRRVFGLEGTNLRPLDPAPLREWLKCVYLNHHQDFSGLAIGMVDVHEILRLHGQVCCTRTPECSRCPVSKCQSRREPRRESESIEVSYSLWDDWRELINEPV